MIINFYIFSIQLSFFLSSVFDTAEMAEILETFFLLVVRCLNESVKSFSNTRLVLTFSW